MCTHHTATVGLAASAKGPGGAWFSVTRATAYFDHPVHAMAGHTLNLDLSDPARGAAQRIAVELPIDAAHALLAILQEALEAVPSELLAHEQEQAALRTASSSRPGQRFATWAPGPAGLSGLPTVRG